MTLIINGKSAQVTGGESSGSQIFLIPVTIQPTDWTNNTYILEDDRLSQDQLIIPIADPNSESIVKSVSLITEQVDRSLHFIITTIPSEPIVLNVYVLEVSK